MAHQACFLLVLVVMATTKAAPTSSQTKDVDLLMPGVSPQVPDTYLCRSMKMPAKTENIIGFKPHANMEVAHHILLYGCGEPGSTEEVWNCGEMAAKQGSYSMAPTCSSGTNILYAWAMDAPSLTLPPDVGFQVGGDTSVKYLVLQVHYKNVSGFKPPVNGKDSSGLTLTTTNQKMKRRAGVYLLGTGGSIPAHSIVYMESACSFPGGPNIVIHPFAYRTHAHSLGRVVSGYRVRNGQWTEIGRMDPRKPQMFYNATTPGLKVKDGDVLAARCTMENTLDHEVHVGSTQNDEMCNFYVMYYVDGDDIINDPYCFTLGPPMWNWSNFQAPGFSLDKKPPTISTVPTNNRTLIQTVSEPLERDPEPRDLQDILALMEELEDSNEIPEDDGREGSPFDGPIFYPSYPYDY